MSDDIIKRLREAIAAGPTPGEWVYLCGDRFVYTRLEDGCRGTPVVNADCLYGEAHFSTLQFVAACNPVAIRTLLDRLDATERENERLTAERDELRRQLAEAELDARRYRWLRNEANSARKCDPMVCIYPLDEQDLIDGDRLDVAIDEVMDLTRPAEES